MINCDIITVKCILWCYFSSLHKNTYTKIHTIQIWLRALMLIFNIVMKVFVLAFILSLGKQKNQQKHIKMLNWFHITANIQFYNTVGYGHLTRHYLFSPLNTSFPTISFFPVLLSLLIFSFLFPVPFFIPPSHSAPSHSDLFISSKWSKEYALFLKEQEKEKRGEVGEEWVDLRKKRKIETEREDERRGVIL